MDILKSPILTFAAGAVIYAAYVLGFISETIMLAILGLVVPGGMTQLRLIIKTPGFKTFGVAAIIALGAVGLLTGFATPDQVGLWYGGWGIVGGLTLAHAIQKKNGK